MAHGRCPLSATLQRRHSVRGQEATLEVPVPVPGFRLHHAFWCRHRGQGERLRQLQVRVLQTVCRLFGRGVLGRHVLSDPGRPLKLVEQRGSWWPAEVAILTATSALALVVVLVLILLYVLQIIVVVVVEVKLVAVIAAALEGRTTDSRGRNASSWCFSVCYDVYD